MLLMLPAATAEELPAFARLQPGLWQIRELNDGVATSLGPICLGDPMRLVQLEHGGASCLITSIEDSGLGGTIHYNCGRAGIGRTTIRIETPRLAKIQTHGINRNEPFDRRLEAQRMGPCPGNRRSGR